MNGKDNDRFPRIIFLNRNNTLNIIIYIIDS